jgi:hypothetical protein
MMASKLVACNHSQHDHSSHYKYKGHGPSHCSGATESHWRVVQR